MTYSKRNRLSELSQQNRNTNTIASPPETDQLIDDESTKDAKIEDNSQVKSASAPSKLALNQSPSLTDAIQQPTTSDASNSQTKTMSKAAVLRHLFFSQISSNTNAAATETSTKNLASSKGE